MESAKSRKSDGPEQLSVREILVKARELISDPARWTQGVAAKNARGEVTAAVDGDAVCWCSYGAIRNVVGWHDNRNNLIFRAECHLNHAADTSYISFNDRQGRTHAEVLAMFDKAIEAAS